MWTLPLRPRSARVYMCNLSMLYMSGVWHVVCSNPLTAAQRDAIVAAIAAILKVATSRCHFVRSTLRPGTASGRRHLLQEEVRCHAASVS